MKIFDDVKARLGSISPKSMNTLPPGVRKLLEEDMPKLIQLAEKAEKMARMILLKDEGERL